MTRGMHQHLDEDSWSPSAGMVWTSPSLEMCPWTEQLGRYEYMTFGQVHSLGTDHLALYDLRLRYLARGQELGLDTPLLLRHQLGQGLL